jgi:hypothetical protein
MTSLVRCLGTELVTGNHHGGMASAGSDHVPTHNQTQTNLGIQWHWPTDGDFDADSGLQSAIGREQNTAAANVDAFARALFVAAVTSKKFVADFSFYWESGRISAIDVALFKEHQCNGPIPARN